MLRGRWICVRGWGWGGDDDGMFEFCGCWWGDTLGPVLESLIASLSLSMGMNGIYWIRGWVTDVRKGKRTGMAFWIDREPTAAAA